VTDQPHDDRDRPSTADDSDQTGGRRSVWSRRIAIAVLVTFGAFVLFNAVAVLVLIYSSVSRGGGGPFGP
jgi:hypothetical protein